jgi:hypothetical protein
VVHRAEHVDVEPQIRAPLVGHRAVVVPGDVDREPRLAAHHLVELRVGLGQLVLRGVPDVLAGAEPQLAVERGDQQPVAGEPLDHLDPGVERELRDDVVRRGARRRPQPERWLAVPRDQPDLVDWRASRRYPERLQDRGGRTEQGCVLTPSERRRHRRGARRLVRQRGPELPAGRVGPRTRRGDDASGHLLGLLLHRLARLADAPAAGRPLRHPALLRLHHVGQLVRDQLAASRGARIERPRRKEHILADRERARSDRPRRLPCDRVRVQPNPT